MARPVRFWVFFLSLTFYSAVSSIKDPVQKYQTSIHAKTSDLACEILYQPWIETRKAADLQRAGPGRKRQKPYVSSINVRKAMGVATRVGRFECKDHMISSTTPVDEPTISGGYWFFLCRAQETMVIESINVANNRFRRILACQSDAEKQAIVSAGTTGCADVEGTGEVFEEWSTSYFPEVHDILALQDAEFLSWAAKGSSGAGTSASGTSQIYSPMTVRGQHYRACAKAFAGGGNIVLHVAALSR